MDTPKDPRLAVLIDADNIPYANIKEMLEEIAKYGNPTFKRIYADWTKPTVSGWKAVLLENAITPVQQYSYTSGKNATDSAMIIDAMDILYTGRVDGFCLVSSDSDFTRLATRLREAGMKVFGLGERKTPVSFISACDKFIYIEILKEGKENARPLTGGTTRGKQKAGAAATAGSGLGASQGGSAKKASGTAGPETSGSETTGAETTAAGTGAGASKTEPVNKPENLPVLDKALVKLISDSINDLAGEDGWTFLGELGNLLLKKKPDFDPRNYGFKKLVPLIKSIDRFEIDERNTGRNHTVLAYVRAK